MKNVLLLLLISTFPSTMVMAAPPTNVVWETLGDSNNNGSGATGALNNVARAMAIHPGGDIIVGGEFQNVAGIPQADYIARYNPNTEKWSALGDSDNSGAGVDGALDATILDITVGSDGRIWVAGDFSNAAGITEADFVAVFDPTTDKWAALGDRTNDGLGNDGAMTSTAYHISIGNDGKIYAGGGFVNVGGLSDVDGLAKFDLFSQKWSNVGSASIIGVVRDVLHSPDGIIYVAGYFDDLNGLDRADNIAAYRGSTGDWLWLGTDTSGLDGALNNGVVSLAMTGDGKLVVAGGFVNAGDIAQADRIAYFDPGTSKWAALGDSNNNGTGADGIFSVQTLYGLFIDSKDTVYAGANFTNVGGIPQADGIVSYDPLTATWSALGDSNNDGTGADGAWDSYVLDIAADPDGKLYAVGFTPNIAGIAQADFAASFCCVSSDNLVFKDGFED